MSDEMSTSALRRVILCDERGRPTGSAELSVAHSGHGQLHLAFSVYVFSPDRRSLLIQQRSKQKSLWPLAWANTCCSHVREDEDIVIAARRRLREEMGIACDLARGPEFVYQAYDSRGRGVEHEYDVILIGTSDSDAQPDPAEVAAWKWIELERLRHEMRERPECFAPWFHLGLSKVDAKFSIGSDDERKPTS